MNKKLEAARGNIKSDLVIKGCRIANVLSLDFEEADVAVKDGIIVGVGSDLVGKKTVDASGKLLIPGMIDGHLHIESTMLSPCEFARAVAPNGTTTVMPDPHEIANTCGLAGIEFMCREAFTSPIDFFFGAPSCVPASLYETPRKHLDEITLMECFARGLCTHLGEMMNYPGVISGNQEVWAKIVSAHNSVRTGHMPGLSGRDLCSYLLSGCDSDHEITTLDEAREKLRRGVWVMMREGASSNELSDIIGLVVEDEARYSRCMAVSDDLTASYLINSGHMTPKIKLMIKAGVRPIVALAMVTITPAQYFRLYDRGAIAPGYIADMALVDSLEECTVSHVWKRGQLIAENGKPLFESAEPIITSLPKFKPAKIRQTVDSIRVDAHGDGEIRVIGVNSRLITTRELHFVPKVKDGAVVSDVEHDILKVVVVEKNKGSGRTAVGFVKGIGLREGAIASSVAHDAHNFIVIGADDESIITALDWLVENNGGVAVVRGDKIIEAMPLPIGGLMSRMDANSVADEIDRLIAAAQKELGTTLPQPFMTMSFLSLSVVPELRITDKGYIDLANGGVVPLYV